MGGRAHKWRTLTHLLTCWLLLGMEGGAAAETKKKEGTKNCSPLPLQHSHLLNQFFLAKKNQANWYTHAQLIYLPFPYPHTIRTPVAFSNGKKNQCPTIISTHHLRACTLKKNCYGKHVRANEDNHFFFYLENYWTFSTSVYNNKMLILIS